MTSTAAASLRSECRTDSQLRSLLAVHAGIAAAGLVVMRRCQGRRLRSVGRRSQGASAAGRACALWPGALDRLQAKERTLDQLHWRLATVARQTAVDDLGNAA